jgi:nucleoside-diphosphate-sugar epimerase
VTRLRILVLGASNFVGTKVVKALAEGGWAQPIVVRELHQSSFDSLGDLDGIVNAAVGGPKLIRSQAQRAIATAQSSGGVTRIVHLSSMTVYGSQDRNVDESTVANADLGAYSTAQVDAERIIQGYRNSVTLRPGCEYGPGCPQWSMRIARLLMARRLGDLGVAGDGWCNLIYIDDLISIILQCVRRPDVGGETFNVTMTAPPTWNEYLVQFGVALHATPIRRITARRLRVESKLLAVPLRAAEIVSTRLNHDSMFKMPAITPSLLRLCRQRIIIDSTKAERQFGITWTPLPVGIQETAATLSRWSGA